MQNLSNKSYLLFFFQRKMSNREYEISTRAYCKMIMHSAKYPNSSLNGLLLARREDMNRGKTVRFCDSIPLFHIAVGLTPMLEMALAQVGGH